MQKQKTYKALQRYWDNKRKDKNVEMNTILAINAVREIWTECVNMVKDRRTWDEQVEGMCLIVR